MLLQTPYMDFRSREWAGTGREGKARGKGKVEGWREGEGKKWEELRKGKGRKEGK